MDFLLELTSPRSRDRRNSALVCSATRLMFIRLKLALPLKLFFRWAKEKNRARLRRLKRDGRIRGLRD